MNYQQIIYVSVSLIVLISFLLIFLLVLPSIRGIAEESAQLTLQQKELASIELMAENFEDFERNYRFYEEGLEEMENLLSQESLIDPEIPVSFINFFKEEAQALNLDLKISPMSFQEKEDRFWGYLSFRIDGTGEFTNLMKFLKKIENSRWLVEITSLTIRRQKRLKTRVPEEVDESELMGINLLIEVYAQD